MNDIKKLDEQLNTMIVEGKALEAFEKFYADDCKMQEGLGDIREGKALNREYEEKFFSSVAEVHSLTVHGQGASEDRSYSEWTYDLTFKDGNRIQLNQVAARTWKDGKVVYERFYSA